MSDQDHERIDDDLDVAVLYDRSEDGAYRALRARRGQVEMSVLRPLVEGQPISQGEVVSLRKREDSPILWDVVVHYARPGSDRAARSGPARVSSDLYRARWDDIFGPQDPDELN